MTDDLRRNPWRHAARLALLAACLALLCGCGTLLLTPTEEVAPAEDDGAPYLRLAAAWAAAPLAEDLLRAYGGLRGAAPADLRVCEERLAEALLADGQADLAIVPRPLAATPEQAQHEITLALDALAIVVHPDLPLHRIAPRDLALLYRGHIADWAALEAGAGQPEVLSREEGALARTLFEGVILQGEALTSAALILPHDRAVVDYVASHPLAIGYASQAAVDGRVKVISLDGLLPAVTALEQGRYPLTYRLALLRAADAPPAAQRLAAFAVSSHGQRAIAQRYVLP